jgi:hypothetical protein
MRLSLGDQYYLQISMFTNINKEAEIKFITV